MRDCDKNDRCMRCDRRSLRILILQNIKYAAQRCSKDNARADAKLCRQTVGRLINFICLSWCENKIGCCGRSNEKRTQTGSHRSADGRILIFNH